MRRSTVRFRQAAPVAEGLVYAGYSGSGEPFRVSGRRGRQPSLPPSGWGMQPRPLSTEASGVTEANHHIGPLRGQRVLVVGRGSGIARAVTLAARDAGATVVAAGRDGSAL